MSRLLFFVVLCCVVYLLVRSGGRKRGERRQEPPAAESMVACARCGLYLPAGESLVENGRHYCCQEHLRLDAGDHAR
jgi:uncharacterized protein